VRGSECKSSLVRVYGGVLITHPQSDHRYPAVGVVVEAAVAPMGGARVATCRVDDWKFMSSFNSRVWCNLVTAIASNFRVVPFQGLRCSAQWSHRSIKYDDMPIGRWVSQCYVFPHGGLALSTRYNPLDSAVPIRLRLRCWASRPFVSDVHGDCCSCG